MPFLHALQMRRAPVFTAGAGADLSHPGVLAGSLRGAAPGQPIVAPDGRLLATMALENDGRLLVGHWLGHCTPESVEYVMRRAVALVERHHCVAVLSDGSRATGDWSDLLPWMQYELLPRIVRSTVRYVANVRSENPASRLAHLEYAQHAARYLRIQVFDDVPAARAWLHQLLHR